MEPQYGGCATIIPVYNDAAGLETTVTSVLSTDSEGQIIIVDNDSYDCTPAVCQQFSGHYDAIVFEREVNVQSSYAARNTGIRNTDAEVLAFLDADMTVAEDYFESALTCLHNNDLDYLGCRVNLTILKDEDTFTARYNAHTGFPVAQYLARHRYVPTCALFVRRKVFEEVGLFDPRLISGGDMEFGNRVAAAGFEMGYCPDAVASHPVRSSLRSLYEKNVRVGRGHAQLQRYHSERYGEPPIPPRHPPLDTDEPDLSLKKRFAFDTLSTVMTAARASGYVQELASPSNTGADVDGPPSL